MSRLGKIAADLEVVQKQMSIRFQARNQILAQLLASQAQELISALRKIGYEASITTEATVEEAPRSMIEWVTETKHSKTFLDIHI